MGRHCLSESVLRKSRPADHFRVCAPRFAAGCAIALSASAAVLSIASSSRYAGASSVATERRNVAVRLPIRPVAITPTAQGVWIAGPRGEPAAEGAALRLDRAGRVSTNVDALGKPVSIAARRRVLYIGDSSSRLAAGSGVVLRLPLPRVHPATAVSVPSPSALVAGKHGVWVLTAGGSKTSMRYIPDCCKRVTVSLALPGTAPRPQLVSGAGFLWTLTAVGAPDHPSVIDRVDVKTHQITSARVAGIATALAFGRGSLWVATTVLRGNATDPEIVEVNPHTFAQTVKVHIPAYEMVYGHQCLVVASPTGLVSTVAISRGSVGHVAGSANFNVDQLAISGETLWLANQNDMRVVRLHAPTCRS